MVPLVPNTATLVQPLMWFGAGLSVGLPNGRRLENTFGVRRCYFDTKTNICIYLFKKKKTKYRPWDEMVEESKGGVL